MRINPNSSERLSESSVAIQGIMKPSLYSPSQVSRRGQDPLGYAFTQNYDSSRHSSMSSANSHCDQVLVGLRDAKRGTGNQDPDGVGAKIPNQNRRQEETITTLAKFIWDRNWEAAEDRLAQSGHRTSEAAVESSLPCFPLGRSVGLPLHLACTMRPLPPVSFVQSLVRAYPDACRIRQPTWGLLPLHLAADLSLHKNNKTAASKIPRRVNDRKGNDVVMPRLLHLTSNPTELESRDAAPEVPSSLSWLDTEFDSTGATNHTQVVHFLIRVYPESIYAREDSNGMLPLHIAASTARSENGVVSPTSAAVLQVLIQSAPPTRDMVDGYGDTPVALAWREALFCCYQCGHNGNISCLCKNRVSVPARCLHPLMRDDIETVTTPSGQQRRAPPIENCTDCTVQAAANPNNLVIQTHRGEEEEQREQPCCGDDNIQILSTLDGATPQWQEPQPQVIAEEVQDKFSSDGRIQVWGRNRGNDGEGPSAKPHRTGMLYSQACESSHSRTALKIRPRPATPPTVPKPPLLSPEDVPKFLEEPSEQLLKEDQAAKEFSHDSAEATKEAANKRKEKEDEHDTLEVITDSLGGGKGTFHSRSKEECRVTRQELSTEEKEKSANKLEHQNGKSKEGSLGVGHGGNLGIQKGVNWTMPMCKRRVDPDSPAFGNLSSSSISSDSNKQVMGESKRITMSSASSRSETADEGAVLQVAKSQTQPLILKLHTGRRSDRGGTSFDFSFSDGAASFKGSSHLRRQLLDQSPVPAGKSADALDPWSSSKQALNPTKPPPSPGMISNHSALSSSVSSGALHVLRVQLRLTDLRRPVKSKHPKRPPNPYYELFVTNGETIASRYQSYPLMGISGGTWDEALIDVSKRHRRRKHKSIQQQQQPTTTSDSVQSDGDSSVDGVHENLKIGIRVLHCKGSQMRNRSRISSTTSQSSSGRGSSSVGTGGSATMDYANVIGLCRTSLEELQREPRQPILNGFQVMGWLEVLQISLV